MLESLAYVASRWEHRVPVGDEPSHHKMPQAIGLFGLFGANEAGFTNTLDLVAAHANVDKTAMVEHVETYIMATAAYLEAQLLNMEVAGKSLEASKQVLATMSGLPNDGSEISKYAINSYLYDLFSIQAKGSDANGIMIKAQNVNWGKVFKAKELKMLRAPGLLIDPKTDSISLKGEQFINSDQKAADKVKPSNQQNLVAVDYPGALWTASPNYSSRSGSAISHVAIHTTQGSYAGAISWLANPAAGASAHYVIRSSDGQVTQMVRDTDKAWHARSANPYSIGIEHEGYVSSSSWYTGAMYNSSADLTSYMCNQHGIDCNSAYNGSGHSTTVELSSAYTVKGHQHYPSQSHTDPGIYWDWAGYHTLLNGSGGGTPTVTILDDFESGEGSFDLYPTYSGSTTGISSSSTAARTSAIDYNGSYSEQIKLVDNSSSSSSWAVRFLSNSGSSSSNTKLTVNNGKVGFWVYSGGSGLTAAIGMDDSDGTERSTTKSIPANQWTFLEWTLDDSSDWNPWYLGNGALSASQVSIDAIWFFRAQTSYNVYLYIDDVQYSSN
ncbi:MAG: N-acetylmuramoyl-L-alanine amidase [Algicola sp.]|nr:N-acetylmuramoyl-L-alanine amidase [Algicola sp.]